MRGSTAMTDNALSHDDTIDTSTTTDNAPMSLFGSDCDSNSEDEVVSLHDLCAIDRALTPEAAKRFDDDGFIVLDRSPPPHPSHPQKTTT
jgi:hypothetical protein